MYRQTEVWIEDVCYEEKHIQKVLKEIQNNFERYFSDFVDTTAGTSLSTADFEKLQQSVGLAGKVTRSKRKNDLSGKYQAIIADARNSFEQNREKYLDLLDEENLEEDGDDVAAFKAKRLRDDCPIIHSTLYNKQAKELDKYRKAFSLSDPKELYQVVTNLRKFAAEYEAGYDPDSYDDIASYDELGMGQMDTDDCTVYGVIGGGIKSHLLYKLYPGLFPNRSRSAIWALWYLTNKKVFGCEMDSEFLMIDVEKSITQQNYNYPYELFAYYAFEIYKLLKAKAVLLSTDINDNYRYVAVDTFLNFVADQHDGEIALFKSQIRDGGAGYA